MDIDDEPILERRSFRSEHPIRSFFEDLSDQDQKRMIAVTRLYHARNNPGKPELSYEQCVRYINMLGPKVRERELKRAVDAKLV